jgi:hypothetical protein
LRTQGLGIYEHSSTEWRVDMSDQNDKQQQPGMYL